jgi:hopanoid biosynthesis associated protein HpnK
MTERGDHVKHLVVVADDFGASPTINRAVIEAHEGGIVTAASLVAGGDSFEEGIRLARSHPGLSVGLHATLCDGRAVLPTDRIPGIVDEGGWLEPSPARAGWRYGLRWRALRHEIERELEAQLDRLADAGIVATHVDGHHHLHVHPMVFRVLCREAGRRGVRWIRVPQGDLSSGGVIEWAGFGALGWINRLVASRNGLRTADRVHGLSRTGRMDEAYLIKLLRKIGSGWNELFVHPDTGTRGGLQELRALTSPDVAEEVRRLGIMLRGYHESPEQFPERPSQGELK